MTQYAVQTELRLSVAFTNALTGALTDPTTVEFQVVSPLSVIQMITDGIVKDGTGLYHYDWTASYAGIWTVRFQGLGALIAATLPQRLVFV